MKNMNKKQYQMKSVMDFIKAFFLSAGVLIVITQFLVQPVVIAGSSMYPTLKNREFGFTSIISTKLDRIERNDIVIVSNEHKKLVKRVIGMPNDVIECINDEIYINNNRLDETAYLDEVYIKKILEEKGYFNKIIKENIIQDWGPVQLNEDEYFLLGDNRPFSIDSRNEKINIIKKEQIVGKDLVIIFPFNRIRKIK